MKQKIIDYIENLESKANDSDKFFVERNNALIEIERLNKELEFERQIKKEVREYIETKYDYLLGDDTFLDHDERIDRKQITNILEILDKVEKVGEE